MYQKNNMNVLLLGNKGYLGSYLCNNLECDVAEVEDLPSLEQKYSYVINCIGKSSLEYCEDYPKNSLYSNALVLSDIIKSQPYAKIINFSSYYVYDSDGPCTEQHPTTNVYNYCRHNLLSEQITNCLGEQGLSFRLGKLFGHPEIDRQNKLFEYIIKNDNVTLDTVMFNPTSLAQVCSVIKFELSTKLLSGVYNLSNKGTISHYEFGYIIKQILDDVKHIKKIDKLDRKFHNYGRFAMDTSYLESFVLLRSWQHDLYEYLLWIKNR